MVILHGAMVAWRHNFVAVFGVMQDHGAITLLQFLASCKTMAPYLMAPCNVTMAPYPMAPCKKGQIVKFLQIWFILR
jgi:hypothetical protein